MNRVAHGPNELKIGSPILTRRGGTHTTAPESTRKSIMRDWHVGILAPRSLENPGKCSKIIPTSVKLILRDQGWPK